MSDKTENHENHENHEDEKGKEKEYIIKEGCLDDLDTEDKEDKELAEALKASQMDDTPKPIWRLRKADGSEGQKFIRGLPETFNFWQQLTPINKSFNDDISEAMLTLGSVMYLFSQSFCMPSLSTTLSPNYEDMRQEGREVLLQTFSLYSAKKGFDVLPLQSFMKKWVRDIESHSWYRETLPSLFKQLNMGMRCLPQKKVNRVIRILNLLLQAYQLWADDE